MATLPIVPIKATFKASAFHVTPSDAKSDTSTFTLKTNTWTISHSDNTTFESGQGVSDTTDHTTSYTNQVPMASNTTYKVKVEYISDGASIGVSPVLSFITETTVIPPTPIVTVDVPVITLPADIVVPPSPIVSVDVPVITLPVEVVVPPTPVVTVDVPVITLPTEVVIPTTITKATVTPLTGEQSITPTLTSSPFTFSPATPVVALTSVKWEIDTSGLFVSGADSYQTETITTEPMTTWTPALVPGQTYHIRVTYYSGDLTPITSEVITFTTAAAAPVVTFSITKPSVVLPDVTPPVVTYQVDTPTIIFS